VLRTSRAAEVAPSRDQAAGARAGTAGGQGHGADVAGQGGGPAQLDQHDVIVQVAAVVSGVADDLSRADELLCALIESNVVLTKTELDAAAEKHTRLEAQERDLTLHLKVGGVLISLCLNISVS